MQYCPRTDDIYKIINAVIHILVEDTGRDSILFTMEAVCYDRKTGKVVIKKNKRKRRDAYSDVHELLEQMCSECRYAGEDVYSFACSFSELYDNTYKKDRSLRQCIDYLDRYNRGNTYKDSRLMLLIILCVMIAEALILKGTHY